jgi:hypothetical protein
MIKLKDILLEAKAPSIFIPRRLEDRVERMVRIYIRNGSKGDLDLSNMNLTKLPDILKDITVGGNFYCGNNNLTSLEGAPKSVGASFACSNNKLTSLQCDHITVGGDFYCSFNKLTSLDGAPKTVGGNFHCYQNPVKFTEKQVRSVSDVKGMVGV